MSYYGIRKLKIYSTEEGKFNMSCEYYDSSITDYNNNRVWHNTDKFFKEDINSKEELEYILFKDFLDGNLHVSGNCNKFNCLSWNNNKVELSKEELEELYKLENIKRSSHYSKESVEAYESYRYSKYFKAWQSYLLNQKEENKKKQYYIIRLNYKDFKGDFNKYYLRSKSSLCYSPCLAKVFHKSLNQLEKELQVYLNNNNFSNIEILNITSYLQKENNKLYPLINSQQEKEIIPEKIF